MVTSLMQDFSINFFANLGGALLGVWLAFRLDRHRARRESLKLYGRLLQGCRFELGYLGSSVQHSLQGLKAGSPLGDLLSVALPATGGVLVNPLVFEYAPRPLITVLNAVSEYTQTTVKGLEGLASAQATLARAPQSDALQEHVVRFRRTLAETLTRLKSMIGVAVESLDEEIRRLGLAAQPDPADYAMGQRIKKILTRPIEEPNQDEPSGKSG